jgi:anti-sigma factor ChrR (cupin superfamily)
MALDRAAVLRRSLKPFLTLELDEPAVDALEWRDFGNGLSMCRVARAGKREVVLYRIAANAAADAFLRHQHPGGEIYLVLRGKISDESGVYEAGDLVWLDQGSIHTPRAIGETLILVIWPGGVQVLEPTEGK